MILYSDSVCIRWNLPLEHMFPSVKRDNHTTLKNTLKPFPTTRSKAGMLGCEYSEDAVSFPVPKLVQTVVFQCASSTRPKRDRRTWKAESPLASCQPTKPLPTNKAPNYPPSPLTFGFIQVTWMPSVQLQAEYLVLWFPLVIHWPSMSSVKHCLKRNTFSSEALWAQVCKRS